MDLPHNPDYEMAVIGSVLMDPVFAYTKCKEHEVDETWFFTPDFRDIWGQIEEFARTKDILRLSALSFQRKDNLLDDCVDKTPTASHVEFYIEEMKNMKDRRVGAELCKKYIDRFLKDPEPEVVSSDMVSEAVRITERKEQSIDEMMELDNQHAAEVLKGGSVGLSSFLPEIDMIKAGYSPDEGECVIVSARTSHGKTLFAMDETIHWIDEHKAPVWWAEVDMSKHTLFKRTAARLAGINGYMLTQVPTTEYKKKMFEEAMVKLQRGWAELKGKPLYCSDRRMSIGEIISKATHMIVKYGVRVIVIDHLTKIRTTREEMRMPPRMIYGEWVAKIQDFGIRHKVLTVILVQSNTRDSDKYTSKTPQISGLGSLKESGAIEENSDSVIIINKEPDREAKDFGMNNPFWDMVLNIGKNRLRGPTGLVDMVLWSHKQRFISKQYASELKEETARKKEEKKSVEIF